MLVVWSSSARSVAASVERATLGRVVSGQHGRTAWRPTDTTPLKGPGPPSETEWCGADKFGCFSHGHELHDMFLPLVIDPDGRSNCSERLLDSSALRAGFGGILLSSAEITATGSTVMSAPRCQQQRALPWRVRLRALPRLACARAVAPRCRGRGRTWRTSAGGTRASIR
jgi:hypothetical protein